MFLICQKYNKLSAFLALRSNERSYNPFKCKDFKKIVQNQENIEVCFTDPTPETIQNFNER